MRRFVVTSIVLAVAAATLYPGTTAARTLCQGTCFFWTLSFSPTDPYLHTAPPSAGATSVFLWYVCFAPEEAAGLTAAEFDIHASGGLTILSFTPTNGFLNAGTATALLLVARGCPPGPTPAGTFTMFDAVGVGGAACFANSVNGIDASVDCTGPAPGIWDNRYRGVSTDGSVPCSGTPESCGTVAVERTSWGSTKALYR